MSAISFSLPRWFDLHTHLRQGDALGDYIRSALDMGCAGVLAMPNTKPPISCVTGAHTDQAWSIAGYRDMLMAAGADAFEDCLIPLYLTGDTTPEMIVQGAESGLLRVAKYYPPHGTTNSDFGAPFETFMDNGVFQTMAETGVVLCIHGEAHDLTSEQFFDRSTNAEEIFYRKTLLKLHEAIPSLKIVCEHITTKVAVDFVSETGDMIGATITPQHLLYTIGDLLQGLKYHLYCMPLTKFAADREALLAAVIDPENTKFFAGTDSAPHTEKATKCGCAAGCFTGGIAPQLYATAFERGGCDLSQKLGQDTLRRFLCDNGVAFYGLTPSSKTFILTKQPASVTPFETVAGEIIPLPLGMGEDTLDWSVKVT